MNKEILQSYNTRLNANNTSLDDVLETINSLAEVTGTLEITENGTYDVKQYAEATVNVEGANEPIVEPDYITDGLVAWWEGVDELDENNHWNSRVGTDYISEVLVKAGSTSNNIFDTIKSDNAYRNNMTYGLVTNEDYYIQGYTIEVVGKVNTTASSSSNALSGAGTLISFDKTASPRIAVSGTEQSFNPLNASAGQGMEIDFINCVNKRHKYAIYLEVLTDRNDVSGSLGVKYAVNDSRWYTKEPTDASGMSSRGAHMSVLCYYNNGYYTNGEINSIRIYNRKLTEEELKHNYEIDNARFVLDNYETA